jgi:hypothetical protein
LTPYQTVSGGYNNKAIGRFATISGGYSNTKDLTKNYFNVDMDTTGVINPSENRILWYPLKNAF